MTFACNRRRLWALLSLLACDGCAHVAPYQRERLAQRNLVQAEYVGVAELHMRAVHEGAIGGQLEAMSGCGCN